MSRRRTAILVATLLVLTLWPLSRAGRALVYSSPAEPPDAIVVLASHEWERLPAAAALAARFPESAVLLTEPATVTDANCYRCGERPAALTGLGVAAVRVHVLPDRGSSTRDEALAVRRFVETHPVRRLAIVTSPYHTRRAWATFHHVLGTLPVQVGVYPACGFSPARPDRWWTSAYDRSYVAYEWAALLQYRVKFSIPPTAPSGAIPLADAACASIAPPARRETRPA